MYRKSICIPSDKRKQCFRGQGLEILERRIMSPVLNADFCRYLIGSVENKPEKVLEETEKGTTGSSRCDCINNIRTIFDA